MSHPSLAAADGKFETQLPRISLRGLTLLYKPAAYDVFQDPTASRAYLTRIIMTNTIFTRRRILQTAIAAAAIGAVPAVAFAGNDALLADILMGVTDALQRDWLRRNCRRGIWDSGYWYFEGRRFTPHEYRDFWLSRYEPLPPPAKPVAPPPPARPAAPPPGRGPSGGRGPGYPAPGRGPGPGRGPAYPSPGRGMNTNRGPAYPSPGRGPGPR